jgi:hypothetical protein
MVVKYTTATLDKIADLWSWEFSTTDIGDRLKMSKGSVCRLARDARRAGDERFPERQFIPKFKPVSAPKLCALPPAPAPYKSDGPRIFELGLRQCRYPLTSGASPEHRFCAAPQEEGSPYCSTHTSLCKAALRPSWTRRSHG